jgi:hypothetical protein
MPCAQLCVSCNRSKVGSAESARIENMPRRGDRVVVEQTAAVFFEGRVLAVDGQRLRVQTATKGDSLSVETSDVYLLSAARHPQQAGQLAICGTGAAEWMGCRVERIDGSEVRVVDANGQTTRVTSERVLVPTPVTELNLERHFELAKDRKSFVRAVERAGQPRTPANWKPAAGQRVLAHHDSGWFSAKVDELDDDEISVRWEADQRISEVHRDQIVPEPPYPRTLAKRGDFVLVRPPLSSQAWAPNKVVAVNGAELEVMNVNGERRSLLTRDVVPLGAP